MKKRTLPVPAWLVLVLVFLAAPTIGGEATYVGGKMCVECHDGYEEQLARAEHGKRGFADLSVHGCESCHGPGSVHVEDPEAWQPRVADLSSGEQSAICQSCHSGRSQFFWRGSVHDKRGLSCLTCHSVHQFKSQDAQLTVSSVMEQCFTCHKDVRAETWRRSHHPIREGQIGCHDCHNPHGTQTEKMLSADSLNDQCYSCHAEKRGPFLWDHAPVRENCATCHTPHGSNHLKLQKTSVPYICQQCHSNTRHPGTLYDRTTLADGSQPSNRDFSRACLNCHNAIHGSNHSSGWPLDR